MIVIPISGIIADWEMSSEQNVTPKTLRAAIDAANGDDLRFDINSPGGDVYYGLEMFNLIKNYPGKTETRIVSMAASMGSIIALAGDEKSAEKTAAYMIHNASAIAWGDYRDMRDAADYLEAVTGHLSNIYTDRAGIDNEEARSMMDAETWRYGEALREFGFTIVDAEIPVDPATAKFEALTRYENFKAEMAKHPQDSFSSMQKVAASIGGQKKPEAQADKNSITPAANAGINNNEEKSVMTLDELKAQFPDIYAAAAKVGNDEALDMVKAHITMGEAGNCPELAIKNIKEGASMTASIQAEYMAAGMKNQDKTNRNSDESDLDGLGGQDDGNGADDAADQAAYEANLKKKMGVK